jgi:chemotaxis protein MotB
MARKQKHEEHENHERWLVSYADFITLLFAFFVVMYAISSINQGKYRVLSDSLIAAFNEPKKSFEPIQLGDMVKSATNSSIEVISKPTLIKVPIMTLNNQESEQGKMPGAGFVSSSQDARDIQQIAQEVAEAMQKLVDQGLVTITATDLWVEVEIKDSVLFPSGSAEMRREAVDVLTRVAAILADFTNPIRVEGFTDNVPIGTHLYPSNWELSGARAASVVRLFEHLKIDSERMSAVGYGAHRPIAPNDTAEGRAKNRRVVLVVLADREVEHLLDERFRRSAAPQDLILPNAGVAAAPGNAVEETTPVSAQNMPPDSPAAPAPSVAADIAAAPVAASIAAALSPPAPVSVPEAPSAAPVIPPVLPAPAPVPVKIPAAAEKKSPAQPGAAAGSTTKRPRPPNPRPPVPIALPAMPTLPVRPLELGPPVVQPAVGSSLSLPEGSTPAAGAAVPGKTGRGSP